MTIKMVGEPQGQRLMTFSDSGSRGRATDGGTRGCVFVSHHAHPYTLSVVRSVIQRSPFNHPIMLTIKFSSAMWSAFKRLRFSLIAMTLCY